jgi:hypothetical protein
MTSADSIHSMAKRPLNGPSFSLKSNVPPICDTATARETYAYAASAIAVYHLSESSISSSDQSAAEFLLLIVGAKQVSLPFGRMQAKAAMPQAYVESEEHIEERREVIPREIAEHRRLE